MANPTTCRVFFSAAALALAPAAPAIAGEWTQLATTNVSDVTALGEAIYITKTDGTVWRADNLTSPFRKLRDANGFSRIAAGPGRIYAVGANGTLWRYQVAIVWQGVGAGLPRSPLWTQMPFTDIGDVAVDHMGAIWVTLKSSGKIGLIADRAEKTLLTNPESPQGMRRIGAHYRVWAVNHNGNVWMTDPAYKFVARSPVGVGDAASDQNGRSWLACKNGSIWSTWDAKHFVKDPVASGFDSITDYPAGGGALAVGFNNTLWHYRQGPADSGPPVNPPPSSPIPC